MSTEPIFTEQPSFHTETAVSLAVFKEKLKNLETALETANSKLEKLESDRDKALRWGIILLGTAVMSMAAWIFKLFEKHFGNMV